MSEEQDEELQVLASNITVTDTEESVLMLLAEVLESRKSADPKKSYVANLYEKGLDAILQKVGEEAVETILAAKSADREQLIYETADLWFHSLVMLSYKGLSPDDILLELKRRFGLSGFKQKAERNDLAE